MVSGNRHRLPEEVNVSDLEDLISQISSIDSCRVLCNEWGAIEEVHVLADDGRHPKQIVRDIESALAARWGVQVDHKKISVAQVGSGTESEPSGAAGTRFSLVSLNLLSRPGQQEVEATVVLSYEGKEVSGTATGALSPAQYTRVAVEAGLRAVNELLPDGYSVQMEDLRRLDMSAGPVVTCQLTIVRPRGDMRVAVGAAAVDNDDWACAAVDAVLAAANLHPWGSDSTGD